MNQLSSLFQNLTKIRFEAPIPYLNEFGANSTNQKPKDTHFIVNLII